MKRFVALGLGLALLAPIGLVGCSDESKTETKTTGPGGTTETETKIKTSGDNPPAPGTVEPPK